MMINQRTGFACKIKLFFLLLSLTAYTTAARADVATYSLDNVIMTNGHFITGTFEWTYQAGDFENGSGQFTELHIPGYGSDLTGLNITVDLSSIEFSLAANLDNKSLDIILRLQSNLSPTLPSLLDLSIDVNGVYASKYELIGYISPPYTGGFLNGSITPLLPVPGDLNADRVVNGADIVLAQQIVTGQRQPDQNQIITMDVAPIINGVSSPNGILDTGDLLLIEKKALGLINF